MDNVEQYNPIKTSHWVRIKRGKFRNFLAAVKGINLSEFSCTVIVARRRDGKGKNKRHVGNLDGETVVFKERELELSDIQHWDVNPTQEELDVFRCNSDPCIQQALRANVMYISVGDLVELLEPALFGLQGRVKDIIDRNILLIDHLGDNVTNVQVHVSNVRKKFKVGDHIEIIRGNYKGRRGFITRLEETDAYIYEVSHPGHEVSVLS
jgi:transcription antitermination factor NusG